MVCEPGGVGGGGSIFTFVFTEMLSESRGCWSEMLLPSGSDLELLPESLELEDTPPPECATSTDLHRIIAVHYKMMPHT